MDWWREERSLRQRGCGRVGGVDEAGRGPLAGPVVAACVVLPFGVALTGVRDSKAMTPRQRDRAFEAILAAADGVGTASVDAPEIDRLNILRATHEAMRRAIAAVSPPPDAVLVDGLPVPGLPVPSVAVVQGDGRSATVAAASIVAKVTRDRLMAALDAEHPGYGLAAHKGYPTAEHLQALRRLGPCPIHRRSFAPVAGALNQPALAPDAVERRCTGQAGEAAAARWLEEAGWCVLCRGYRAQGGEIDIVARDGRTLVFVEVKTRATGRTGSPAEAVNWRKRACMAAAAETYLAGFGDPAPAVRFDVVEVFRRPGSPPTLRLIRDAFRAGE